MEAVDFIHDDLPLPVSAQGFLGFIPTEYLLAELPGRAIVLKEIPVSKLEYVGSIFLLSGEFSHPPSNASTLSIQSSPITAAGEPSGSYRSFMRDE
jgi:hypothetical protein